jgi:hypothetical protein
MSALSGNATEQEGRYPDDLFSTNTIRQLREWGIRQPFAGLSGDVDETIRRVDAGLPLDTNISSWVYWPGFRHDDPSELAIIWDRQGGLGFNAHRRKGRSVGFADGSIRLIPTEQWATFLKEQEKLRARVLASRTNPPAPAVFQPTE